MAVDSPVLERIAGEKKERQYAVPTRLDFMAEEEHNARIRDTYARLINPENKIEDVFSRAPQEEKTVTEQPAVREASAAFRPYVVENARADAAIFRADSAINARRVETVEDVAPVEEESEDLRPTPTTIQYQTIGKQEEQTEVNVSTHKKAHVFGKREKIIIAIFVAVMVALVTLVIVNSAIISNLNADIAKVQDSITTVRGAIAGVNSTVEEIIFNGISH